MFAMHVFRVVLVLPIRQSISLVHSVALKISLIHHYWM